MEIINASKISFYVMRSLSLEDWITSYCADGDGIVQLVEKTDRFELLDQLDICKTWLKSDAPVLAEMLENTQSYIAATYHEIFEDSMHWNDDSYTKEDYSAFMGYSFKD
jgi:hypothetical protein